MLKAVWIYHGHDLDPRKVARYRVEDPYYSALHPRLTQALPDGRHFLAGEDEKVTGKPGIYFAWNWFEQMAAGTLAERISNELKRIGWTGNPALCIDIEKGHGLHDGNYVDYVVAFFKRWRQLRPTRVTHWTLEGFQGGLFNNRFDAVQELIAAKVTVVPQAYEGSMAPHRT